jgi:peptidoglycan/LPS O-acetylase OafA/YrhL
VLSGFLITGILLDNRGDQKPVRFWRHFYARRALRIFPLYYATIGVALLLNVSVIRITWPWHIAYLSNFHLVLHHSWEDPWSCFGHFWSLAVEEQFYLLWPFFVLTLSWPRARQLILVLIVLAPISRILSATVIKDDSFIHFLPWSNMDSLGIGSLFALLQRQASERGLTAAQVGKFCLWLGLPLSLIGVGGHRVPYPIYTIGHTGLVLFYGWLVFKGVTGFSGLFGAVLASKALVYVGRISYGLYVFIDFSPLINSFLAAHCSYLETVENIFAWRVLLDFSTLFLMAALSWHLFEKPINDLKKFFPYEGRRRGVDSETIPVK